MRRLSRNEIQSSQNVTQHKTSLHLSELKKPPVVCADSPHWVEVKHGRLELSQFDGGDADSPDVTQVVVAALLLNCSHLWSHPTQTREKKRRRTSHHVPKHTNSSIVRICKTPYRLHPTLHGAVNRQLHSSYQYGVPIKDFLLATEALISAATPKSAGTEETQAGSHWS